jgi:hypothetical protein
MELFGHLGAYLGSALVAAGRGLVLVLGPPAAAMILASVTSSFAERRLVSLLGPRAYLATLGWLGTAVHELAHAAMCLVFRHRITDLRLFDPSSKTGAVGWVEHEWDRRSLYQKVGNFFIGVAPVLLGSILLAGAGWLLLGDLRQVPDMGTDAESLVPTVLRRLEGIAAGLWTAERAADWRTWLLAYLALAIGASMNASRVDLEGALYGIGFLLGAVVVFYLASHWAMDWNALLGDRVAAVQVPLLAALLMVSGLNLAAGLASLVLRRILAGGGS